MSTSKKTPSTRPTRRALPCLALLFLLGCQNEPRAAGAPGDEETAAASVSGIRFEDVAQQAGISFHHFASTRAALLPEDNGSGLAFGDYDNDGYDDLYLANLAGPVLLTRAELEASRTGGKLYHNQGDGTFLDVTEASGLTHTAWDHGVLWADFNGDGWLDLLLTGLYEIALFKNRGDGTFEEYSQVAGLGETPCQAHGATAADYDRDGDLDLYVPCYVDFPWQRARNRSLVGGRPSTMTTPANYPPQANLLLRNDGQGHFLDVAEASGVADTTGRGLQATFVDLDDDGWPDLYVANDQSFDRLFRNLGQNSPGEPAFEDVTIPAGTRDPRAGMGIALHDYNHDGKVDLFLTHWVGEENALYRNASGPSGLFFEDRTFEEGLGPVDPSFVGWGTGFADFDLDGAKDLFLVNGSTVEDEWTLEVLTEPKMIPQPMTVYARLEDRFEDVSATSGVIFERLIVGRGMSFADYDRDGQIDVAVQVHNGSPLLLHNRSEAKGTWLGIQLVGTGMNRWAIGAKVTVRPSSGEGIAQTSWLLAGQSYAGTHSTTLHFGLGSGEKVDGNVNVNVEVDVDVNVDVNIDVDVRWPDGQTTRFQDLPTQRTLILHQSTGGWRELPLEPIAPRPWGAF